MPTRTTATIPFQGFDEFSHHFWIETDIVASFCNKRGDMNKGLVLALDIDYPRVYTEYASDYVKAFSCHFGVHSLTFIAVRLFVGRDAEIVCAVNCDEKKKLSAITSVEAFEEWFADTHHSEGFTADLIRRHSTNFQRLDKIRNYLDERATREGKKNGQRNK